MRNDEFAEASAYLRVLEKRLLTGDSINRITDAAGASETLKLLAQNSGYEFSSLKRTEDYEFVLKDELLNVYGLLYKLSKHREVVDILAAKYDFHNLRVCLKAKYLNRDMSGLYFTVTDLKVSDVESYTLKGEKREQLPSYIVKAISAADAEFEKSQDPQMLDVVLDREMFEYMLGLAESIGNGFITEYVRLSIDFNNIKTLVRVKNMQKGTRFLGECLIPGGITDTSLFIENYDKSPDTLSGVFYYKHFGDMTQKGIEDYGRTGNYARLEKLFDNCLIEYVKKAKYIAFGPEVLFAYIVSKENEIRQIRILMTCKKNGVDTDALKERLRDNYA